VQTMTALAEHLQDQKLAADISFGLEAVEHLLRESVKDEQPFVTETSSHLVNAGGKRLRPLLALLCAQFGPEPLRPQVISGATLCEILHIATLYHDDVMDEAKLRRGVTSANLRWSNTVAILAGDFMFAIGAKLGCGLGAFAIEMNAVTSRRLVTGQLRETIGWSPNLSPREHYLKVVSDKTSSLFSASCQMGAQLALASEEHIALVGQYAESLGVAFQLSDDILDIVGAATGKEVGTDLRARVPTLPVIYLKEAADPADKRLLELVDGTGELTDDEVAEAIDLLREHEVIDRTRAALAGYVAESTATLDRLPPSPATASLRSLANSMITRQA
jgi:heptaprenyl diphosphate synthase